MINMNTLSNIKKQKKNKEFGSRFVINVVFGFEEQG